MGRASQLRVGLLLSALLLAGCGKADSDPGPGGVTVGEARALDDAAAMLDQQRSPPRAETVDGAKPSGQPSPQDSSAR